MVVEDVEGHKWVRYEFVFEGFEQLVVGAVSRKMDEARVVLDDLKQRAYLIQLIEQVLYQNQSMVLITHDAVEGTYCIQQEV